MTTLEHDLIQLWARHVWESGRGYEGGHPSHKQSGSPLYEMPADKRSIRCTAPGCDWKAHKIEKGGANASDRLRSKK